MTSSTNRASLIKRLERTRLQVRRASAVSVLVNPDGPEAAALIRELVEALEPFAKVADAFDYWAAEAMPAFSYPEQSCDLKFALEDCPNAVGELTESDFKHAATLRAKASQ